MLTEFYQRPDSEFVRGQGVWLWDSQGDRYFDAINGVGSNLLGHCEPRLIDVAKNQIDTLWQASNQVKETQRDLLSHRLCSISDMDQVFFHATGSEAMDLALKIAQWNRAGSVVVIKNSFHGTTLSSTLITQWPGTYETFDFAGMDVIQISATFDAIDALDRGPISAVIIEPVLGMGGASKLDPDFIRALYDKAHSVGAIVISDECQCGFYRCGGISVMQDLGLIPDVLILSKGLANGLPLSACLFKQGLKLGRHGNTYGGNAVCCAVANHILDMITAMDLDSARITVSKKLSTLESLDCVKEIRCIGHMIGIQIHDDLTTAWLRCIDQQLLVTRSLNNTLRLMLPINITDIELDILVEKLKGALS